MKTPLLLLAALVVVASQRAWAETLYVSHNTVQNSTISKFTLDGVNPAASVFATSTRSFGDIALDGAGNLFATDSSEIYKFTPGGVRSHFGGFVGAAALTFDSMGNLWGASQNFDAVFEFAPSSGFTPLPLFTVDYQTVRLHSPRGLAFDAAGNLYAANHRLPYPYPSPPDLNPYRDTILKLSPTGVDLGFFASDTASAFGGQAQLKGPWDLIFDGAGSLYASCTDTDTIEWFAPNGTYLGTFASGLNDPAGMTFDNTGNLYVANSGDGTIRKFTPGGVGSVFASGLGRPVSIAIGPEVPEPSAWVLLTLGLSALLGRARLRVKVTAAP